MPDYGQDLSCTVDLSPTLNVVSGSELMGQVCLRRLYCRQGDLLSDPNALTLDARDFISQGISGENDLAVIRAKCTAALLDDERIFSATVGATYSYSTRTLELSVEGTGASGPFSLVLAVSSLTVELLAAS